MNDVEHAVYYKEKFLEIPATLREEAATFLAVHLDQLTKDLIIEAWQREGSKWCTPFHMFWGMSIRNNLRNAGWTDDQLPDGNWDDYYVSLIEYALGLRSVWGDYC